MSNAIELDHVDKLFGYQIAMNQVTYSVPDGSVFALLGENGAGKTTTIRVLLGLCEPDSGTSTVLGMNSVKDDLAIRRSVGYVPEMPQLYDWMTVEEIGLFTASFYPQKEFLRNFIESCYTYSLPLSSRIKALSKGTRAKVALALAIAHDPALLILDEPTSGLDPMVRREFLEGMVDRAAEGRTVFLSSHQIGEVERVADTVAIMKQSRVVVVESLDSLKADTRLLTLTRADVTGDFISPFRTTIDLKEQGRDIRVVGRGLRHGAEQSLADDPAVARFEFRTPTLEEIFIAYMQ